MSTVECPTCKKMINEDALICPQCGTKFPEKYEQFMQKWKAERRKGPGISLKLVIAIGIVAFLGWRTYSQGGFFVGVVDPVVNFVKEIIPIGDSDTQEEASEQSLP